MPPPITVSTDAAFVLRVVLSCFKVWYVGGPVILVGTSGKDCRISAGVGTEVVDMVLVPGTENLDVQGTKGSSLLY